MPRRRRSNRGSELSKFLLQQGLSATQRRPPMLTECGLVLFELAPVQNRRVVAGFDGGAITSNAGVLLLGPQGGRLAWSGASLCFRDARAPERTLVRRGALGPLRGDHRRGAGREGRQDRAPRGQRRPRCAAPARARATSARRSAPTTAGPSRSCGRWATTARCGTGTSRPRASSAAGTRSGPRAACNSRRRAVKRRGEPGQAAAGPAHRSLPDRLRHAAKARFVEECWFRQCGA